jgi:hypothetical protein
MAPFHLTSPNLLGVSVTNVKFESYKNEFFRLHNSRLKLKKGGEGESWLQYSHLDPLPFPRSRRQEQ